MVKTRQIILTDKDTRPSFAKLARKYNCDYRTVKRAYEKGVLLLLTIMLFHDKFKKVFQKNLKENR